MQPLKKSRPTKAIASVILLRMIETRKKKFIKHGNNSAKNEKMEWELMLS
jgi:hypothetical protein